MTHEKIGNFLHSKYGRVHPHSDPFRYRAPWGGIPGQAPDFVRDAVRQVITLLDGGGGEDTIIAFIENAMTGGGDREKCLEAGMDDYISKPVRRDGVFQIVKKWCLDQ